MRIVLLHNYYQQPGGEDIIVHQEKKLLESKGHTVALLVQKNSGIASLASKVAASCRAIYSFGSHAEVRAAISELEPDIVHIHNFFPRFSPSVYYACKTAQLPVVQTLHNFRLVCPNALLFRDGKPCRDCVGKAPWPGIMHGCYRGSRSGTAAVAAMLIAHRFMNTWTRCVDAYIALSEFSKGQFVAGGLPSDRLFVKPNCVMPDPGPRERSSGYALFVGRLTTEKGLRTLIAAWRQLQGRTLKIVGSGPLASEVESARVANIEFVGRKSSADVLEMMGSAEFLVVPSECYENCPGVILEAFSRGVPVLASRIGSAQELVRDGYAGVLFRPGDAGDLAEKADWLFNHPVERKSMSEAARHEYLQKYTADRNYEQLMQIYKYASERSARTAPD